MGRGVLRPDLAATRFGLARHRPSDALNPFVDYYWILRWDLRGEPPHAQTILPHPNVNLSFEASGAGIYGVDRRLFTRSLSGAGRVLGVRFAAGGFRPFWQAPISQLTDRVVPAPRLFGPRAEKSRQAIMDGAAAGMTARTLQRLFADYVGVSPKWVMRRARLHEAAERADSGEPVDWAELAADLGYADQAHLTRDFTVTIGVPPTRYAAASTN